MWPSSYQSSLYLSLAFMVRVLYPSTKLEHKCTDNIFVDASLLRNARIRIWNKKLADSFLGVQKLRVPLPSSEYHQESSVLKGQFCGT